MEPDDAVLAVSRILILFLTSLEERTFFVYYILMTPSHAPLSQWPSSVPGSKWLEKRPVSSIVATY